MFTLKILAHVHAYPPNHCAGAEMMLHSLMAEMASRGHEVNVLLRGAVFKEYQGIRLYSDSDKIALDRLYRISNVVITHLDLTQSVIQLCKRYGKPIVHIVHNDSQLKFHNVRENKTSLIVFNSKWIHDKIEWNSRKIVVTPVVNRDDYKTKRGDHITLINLTAEKGAFVFYELAKMFPDRKFLGVIGGYGQQVINKNMPDNVEIFSHVSNENMKSIYGKTRILLMPSVYESWGRVAIEAAASGIPTIAHPTPGLLEALGDSGLFANRANIGQWAKCILALDDEEFYKDRSKAANKRSKELNPQGDYDLFESSILDLVNETSSIEIKPQVDFLVTMSHYADHVVPIWNALPAEIKGKVYAQVPLDAYVKSLGCNVVPFSSGNNPALTEIMKEDFGPVVTCSADDLSIASRSGRPQIFCEHGSGQSYSGLRHASYAGGNGRNGVVLFLTPNALVAEKNKERYPNIPNVIIGCPKLDRFIVGNKKNSGDIPVVAVSFHWDCSVVPETQTTWNYYKSALETLTKRFKVIGHGHPRIISKLVSTYREFGIEVVYDFSEVMTRADVYAVDNSSTLFEFAALDKPVVVLNAPWFRRDVEHGMRFWELSDVGVCCDSPHELVNAVELALTEPKKVVDRRHEVVDIVYPVNDGTSTQKAVEAIKTLLREG